MNEVAPGPIWTESSRMVRFAHVSFVLFEKGLKTGV